MRKGLVAIGRTKITCSVPARAAAHDPQQAQHDNRAEKYVLRLVIADFRPGRGQQRQLDPRSQPTESPDLSRQVASFGSGFRFAHIFVHGRFQI